MKIKHPKWSRVVVPLGIVFFIGLAFLPLYALRERIQPPGVIILTLFSSLFLYLAYLGYDLFSHRNIEMEIEKETASVIFIKGAKTIRLKYDEVSYRSFNSMQLIYFYNKTTGEKLAVYDHLFPNCRNIIRWAREHLN